jgi:hypothetical protein
MIHEEIKYTIYGKTVTDRPVVAECKPDATCNGQIYLDHAADTFSAKVYKTSAPTGISKYEADGPDLYTGTILGYTGMDSSLDFTFNPAAVNSPTGAIDGEYYDVKFIASETGIFGGKSTVDIVIKMTANLEV